MGYGGWSSSTYSSSSAPSAFTYSTAAHATAAATGTELQVHPTLDPKGVKLREARDSADHPETLPIAVWLDTTGSNIDQARIVHAAMPTFMGLLLRKGYTVSLHPQIMFSALGDGNIEDHRGFARRTCDAIPIELGQFESDNEIEAQLGNFALEGNGGGQNPPRESYDLALYAMARHTATDHWEKRGEKGYLFLVGDEMAYNPISRDSIKEVFGDVLEADVPLQTVVDEVKEKWHVFFLIPQRASHGRDPSILQFWSKLFQQNAYVIEDSAEIFPRIAALVGHGEGMDADEIVEDLASTGTVGGTALATIGSALRSRRANGGKDLATVTGGTLVPSTTDSDTVRL